MSHEEQWKDEPLTRREVLRLMGLSSLGIIITACASANRPALDAPPPTTTRPGSEEGPKPPVARPAPAEFQASTSGPSPRDFGIDSDIAVTSNENFYTVSYQMGSPPKVDAATWRLTVDGLVEKPLELTLDDIKAMPAVVEMRTLECISNPVGGNLISNAVWKGVLMSEVLGMAGMKSQAKEIKLEAHDGYHTAIPIELAMHSQSLLVYEMNGKPLPANHGFPLRCLWPGRYGMKQPKWLRHVELISERYLGYWEQQGWSNEAFIQPNSQIRQPRTSTSIPPQTYVISGTAFSGSAGIAQVEVSTDDGQTWHPAVLKQAPDPFTPYVWTEWFYVWQNPGPGNYTVLARVTDNDGQRQQRARRLMLLGGTYPDGTDRMHEVHVQVKRS